LAPQGTLALVAAYASEPKLEFDPTQIMSFGRNIVGVVEGGADPQAFIPRLFDYHRRGQLPFEAMIEFYAFDDILSAIADGERGRAIKPVVRMQ
jgi:aryl-alcohol dehydrogenase